MNLDGLHLSDILDRCRECPVCGAPTHFVGGNPSRAPMIDRVIDGVRHRLLVRRVVWQMMFPGKQLPDGRTAVITSSCTNHRCVNPELIFKASKSEAWKRAARRGAWADPTARARSIRTVRLRSKLSDAAVAEIHSSAETSTALAARFGVTKAYVCMIRKGMYRRPIASPFAGLVGSC